VDFFLLNQGGMASHGGIAGTTLFCGWYAWKHKISWAGIGDSIVCGAPLGVFLGRIANFINGELFGRVTNVPWAVKFPTELLHEDFYRQGGQPGLIPEGMQHSPEIIAYFEQYRGGRAELEAILHPRHPSQLYEALGEGLHPQRHHHRADLHPSGVCALPAKGQCARASSPGCFSSSKLRHRPHRAGVCAAAGQRDRTHDPGPQTADEGPVLLHLHVHRRRIVHRLRL
jgi:hypothetical protein